MHFFKLCGFPAPHLPGNFNPSYREGEEALNVFLEIAQFLSEGILASYLYLIIQCTSL